MTGQPELSADYVVCQYCGEPFNDFDDLGEHVARWHHEDELIDGQPMPDAGVLCPADPDGEHVLAYRRGPLEWYCPRCEAILRLGVWYAPRDGSLASGGEG